MYTELAKLDWPVKLVNHSRPRIGQIEQAACSTRTQVILVSCFDSSHSTYNVDYI